MTYTTSKTTYEQQTTYAILLKISFPTKLPRSHMYRFLEDQPMGSVQRTNLGVFSGYSRRELSKWLSIKLYIATLTTYPRKNGLLVWFKGVPWFIGVLYPYC